MSDPDLDITHSGGGDDPSPKGESAAVVALFPGTVGLAGWNWRRGRRRHTNRRAVASTQPATASFRLRSSFWLSLICIVGSLIGCTTRGPAFSQKAGFQLGESVVLVDEEPATLAFRPGRKPFQVRSTYRAGLPQTMVYEPGRDYIVDYPMREIRRTPQSRIPNFRTNMLFGVEDFDHSKFPGFGNGGFFAFVDYQPAKPTRWPEQKAQTEFLTKARQKLTTGQRVKIIAYGDSITAGGDATEPGLIFWERWAQHLRQKHPAARIEVVNGATGGDATGQGLNRLEQKVLSQNPNLVLIGFGMNDHNIAGFGTPLETFAANLRTMIDQIRAKTGAEIILYSTFPPNPKWHYGSHNMAAYASATEQVAREKGCAFADVYRNWNTIAVKKKPEDLLSNNINHPNDFGHGVYFRVFELLGL